MEEKHIKMIEDIRDALLGNDYNDEGLIKQVGKIKTKVDQHDILFKVGAALMILVSSIAAFWNDIKSVF